VRANILRGRLLPLLPRPLLATAIMLAAMWPARHLPLAAPIVIGAAAYLAAVLLLRVVPRDDLVYWRRVVSSK